MMKYYVYTVPEKRKLNMKKIKSFPCCELHFIMTALTSDANRKWELGSGVGSSPDPHKLSIFYSRTRKLITFFKNSFL